MHCWFRKPQALRRASAATIPDEDERTKTTIITAVRSSTSVVRDNDDDKKAVLHPAINRIIHTAHAAEVKSSMYKNTSVIQQTYRKRMLDLDSDATRRETYAKKKKKPPGPGLPF